MIPAHEQVVNIRPTLYVLLGAVGFVLLIGCANLANLMARASGGSARSPCVLRLSERRRIQQLLTESVLSAIGGVLGILLAT